MGDLQAPWVGLCRDDYYGAEEGEVVGCCEYCDEPLYKGNMHVLNGDRICDKCYKEVRDDD